MYFLIKLPNWLGDAIMFTPTLSLLHRVFPQAKFVIIGNALSTSIFSQNHDRSTVNDYSTDAPEQNHSSTDSNRIKITNPDANNK